MLSLSVDIWRPVVSGASQSLTAQVQALFAGGKVGGMWDMGDTSTLFQDTAGATPVTAAGQSIARVNDKSGNGANCTQATGIAQPLYQVVSTYGCAQFDGVNDLFSVAGVNLSSTDKLLFGMAFKPNLTSVSLAVEYSTNIGGNSGSFYVALNAAGAGILGSQVNNGGVVDAVVTASSIPAANSTYIEYIDLSIAAATSKITARANGSTIALSTSSEGADSPGNFGNYSLFIGSRSGASLPSNMNLYRAFIRAGSATAGEQLILENWLRESCGV